MDVDIAAVDVFAFFGREIKLLIKILREVALDEGTLRRHQGTIKIRVFAIPQPQHVVGVFAQLFKRLCVLRLVVAVFGVGRGHVVEVVCRERLDHDVVQINDGHVGFPGEFSEHRPNNRFHVALTEHLVATHGRLIHSHFNLLRDERFFRPVLLDNGDVSADHVVAPRDKRTRVQCGLGLT